MAGINYLAVIAAAVAALIQGALWYSVLFGSQYLSLRGIDPAAMADMRPPVWEMVFEFVRCLVVAAILAGFLVRLDIASFTGALLLALALWVGFQAMAILGAVIHEGYSWRLYAIHTGDALVKIVLMSLILVASR